MTNKILFCIIAITLILLSGCSKISLSSKSTETPIITITASITPTETSVPTNSPTPTYTPDPTKTASPTMTPTPIITIEPYTITLSIDWPMPLISDEQISEVKNCNIEEIANSRYPSVNVEHLIYAYSPQSACDWAVLAYAYIQQISYDTELPLIAKNAYAKAVTINPGFIFSAPLFYSYFGAIPMVKGPALFEQDITSIRVEYNWSGIGDPVQYTMEIQHANTNPIVELSNYEPATITENLTRTVSVDLIQSLDNSLSDLIPIKTQFSLTPCYDNLPDWKVTLIHEDGNRLILKTNGSNMITIGGPWQVSIDGQDYIQYSNEFLIELDKIIREIGLPYGQPAAWTCFPQGVIDLAYPISGTGP